MLLGSVTAYNITAASTLIEELSSSKAHLSDHVCHGFGELRLGAVLGSLFRGVSHPHHISFTISCAVLSRRSRRITTRICICISTLLLLLVFLPADTIKLRSNNCILDDCTFNHSFSFLSYRCRIYSGSIIQTIVVCHMQCNQINAMMVMGTKGFQMGNKSYPTSAQKLSN